MDIKQTETELAEYQNDHDLLIRLDVRLSELIKSIDKNTKEYVTKAEFWPVKILVYGVTGIILTAVITAVVYLVVHH